MPSCQQSPAVSNLRISGEGDDISGLLAMLGGITDPRKARGKIYSLSFMLASALVATLAGATGLREIGSRVADFGQDLLARLGAPFDHFTGRYRAPSEKAIRALFEKMDVAAVDAAFGAWLFAHAVWEPGEDIVLAMDAKVLRGAWSEGNKQVTLLSAMVHANGLVAGQVRVPDGTNEITQVAALLENLPDISGPVVATLDAVHTQHETAFLLVEHGIDYALTVKGNQPTLYRKTFEQTLPLLQKPPQHEVEERGHGRIKKWQAWTTEAKGIGFPEVATAAVIRRDEFDLKGIRVSREYAHILTSVAGNRATAAYIHRLIRGHWGIENEIHYPRDTAWREDANQTRTGNSPHTLASFRNLAIGIIRRNGIRKIKETLEYIAGDRDRVLPLLATACH
ncbi:transposase IS4 family protein [Parafrankia sp. EAN1pec]|nr:transposase IS4 family protein [Frankia sp. EAN1pec]